MLVVAAGLLVVLLAGCCCWLLFLAAACDCLLLVSDDLWMVIQQFGVPYAGQLVLHRDGTWLVNTVGQGRVCPMHVGSLTSSYHLGNVTGGPAVEGLCLGTRPCQIMRQILRKLQWDLGF